MYKPSGSRAIGSDDTLGLAKEKRGSQGERDLRDLAGQAVSCSRRKFLEEADDLVGFVLPDLLLSGCGTSR